MHSRKGRGTIMAPPMVPEPALRALRRGGGLLLAAGLLWQPLLAAENLDHLRHRSAAWAWYADQTGFLVAMVLLLLGIFALGRGRVSGDGRSGRWALRGLALGWSMLVAGQVLSLLTGWDATALQAPGGLLTFPTAVVAGVAAVRAGRLVGWRRWALLAQGGYASVVILGPLLAADWGPSWATEAGWQLSWALVGWAALTSTWPRPAGDGKTATEETAMLRA